jgi:hypothetical protein
VASPPLTAVQAPLATPMHMADIGWPELVTVMVTLGLVAGAVVLHYEGLSWIGRLLKARAIHHRAKIVVLIFMQLSLHVAEIWLFALGYFWLIQQAHFGAMLPAQPLGLLDYVYFSAVTYTTVGFGDFVPAGAVRFVTGMEALTGFVLITWSASFTFLEMQRYWGRD